MILIVLLEVIICPSQTFILTSSNQTQYHEVTSSVVVVEDVVQAKARGVGTKSEIYNQEGGVY